MIREFTKEDHYHANLLAQRGTLLKQAGAPSSAEHKLPNAIDVEFFPASDLAPVSPKGLQHVVAGLRRLAEWRTSLNTLSAAPEMK